MVKLKKKYKSIKTIKDVKSLAARLAPLQRHAITEGTKNAIKILNEYLNFNLVNIKSNTVCWDWNIPKQWKHIDNILLLNPIPEEFRKKVNILCYDCKCHSESDFHFDYIKCMNCNSYNTTIKQ